MSDFSFFITLPALCTRSSIGCWQAKWCAFLFQIFIFYLVGFFNGPIDSSIYSAPNFVQLRQCFLSDGENLIASHRKLRICRYWHLANSGRTYTAEAARKCMKLTRFRYRIEIGNHCEHRVYIVLKIIRVFCDVDLIARFSGSRSLSIGQRQSNKIHIVAIDHCVDLLVLLCCARRTRSVLFRNYKIHLIKIQNGSVARKCLTHQHGPAQLLHLGWKFQPQRELQLEK